MASIQQRQQPVWNLIDMKEGTWHLCGACLRNGREEYIYESLELDAGGEAGVGEAGGVLFDGDEVVEHLVALALLHDELERELADGLEEHLGVEVALLRALRPLPAPERQVQVLQVEPVLLAPQPLPPLQHLLQDVRELGVDALVALGGQLGEKLAQEEGGVVGTPAEVSGVHDASALDAEVPRGLGAGLLRRLALAEHLIAVVVALEDQEGVAHAQIKYYIMLLRPCRQAQGLKNESLKNNNWANKQEQQRQEAGGSALGVRESLHSDLREILQVLVLLLHVAHEAEEVRLLLHELGLIEPGGGVVEVGAGGLGLAAAAAVGELAVLDEVGEVGVVLLDVAGELVVLVGMDAQEGGHHDQLLHLRVVVAVVEELVEAVAGLLRLSHEEEVVPHLLGRRLPDALQRELRELLDVGVVDGEVGEVVQEEIDDFVVLQVVAAHLVEGELRLEDVVAEVEDHEALADHFDVAALLLRLEAVEVALGEAEAVDVEYELLEVLAVEGDDVLVDELPLHRVRPSPLLPLLPLRGEDVAVDLFGDGLHELRVVGLLDDVVGEGQPLDALHVAAGADLAQDQRDQLAALLLRVVALAALGGLAVDADADLVVQRVVYIDIDAHVTALLLRRRQHLAGHVQDTLRSHHFVRLVHLTLLKHLLQLAPPEQPLEHRRLLTIQYQGAQFHQAKHPTLPKR